MKTEDYHRDMKRLAAALADVPNGAAVARRLVRIGLGDISADALGVLCHYLTGASVKSMAPAKPTPAPAAKKASVRRRKKAAPKAE